MRPLCKACNKNPAAINGYHNDRIYYRSRCSPCIRRKKREKVPVPRWQSAGYKKKSACDRCGFRSRLPAKQLTVYHIDGDLNNCELRNLKTICLNCAVDVTQQDLPWQPGDLEPDH